MEFHVERIFKGPGFAETLFLGTCGGRRIIRKSSNPDARPFSRTALIREILLLAHLPCQLRPFFPELIRTNLGDRSETSENLPKIIYYDMPYYAPENGWATLSRLLLDGTIDPDRAKLVLGEIMDTAFLYFRLDDRDPDTDYLEKTMLRAIRESIEWASADSDFRQLFSIDAMTVSGKLVSNVHCLMDCFRDTGRMRELLTPSRDRFLHGDFFPENILYNTLSGKWILLDPVSVRGVHRGDFILDVNKMDDWLSGELPALRLGQFSCTVRGSTVDFEIHRRSGKLKNLHRSGLSDWYRERLEDRSYAGVFSEEPGWDVRWMFIKAFYAFCMLPLAEKRQAVARYFLALLTMNDFLERTGEEG